MNLKPSIKVLDAICHTKQTIFPEDLLQSLLDTGTDENTAKEIVNAYVMQTHKDIFKLYEDYGYGANNDTWKKAIAGVITERMIRLLPQSPQIYS